MSAVGQAAASPGTFAKETLMNPLRTNRRRFLLTTTAIGATTLSSRTDSVLGANDRIQVGIIGVGGKGMDHLNWFKRNLQAENVRVAAVCDVYNRRVRRAAEASGAESFTDYRKLLEKKDLDAVFVVTPDHWHAKISIEALEAGKHVYCEKPMTLTAEEAIKVRDAVRRHSRVFQVGPNGTARDKYWKSQQAIREGRVGKVTWGQASVNRNIRGCAFNVWFPIDKTAGPDKGGDDYVNWEMWLGHEWGLAPRIPWNPEHFFRFRKYWPYNGGVATDLIYHALAPMLLAIAGDNGEYPKRVNASGGLYLEKDGRDIPDVFMMSVDYPSEFSLNLVSVLTNDTNVPTRIYGRYGTIDLTEDEPRMEGNGDYVSEFEEHNNGYKQVTLPVTKRKDLQGNFLDVIRGNGKLCCNVNLGASTMVAIKLAVESYRQNRTMLWDSAKETVAAGS